MKHRTSVTSWVAIASGAVRQSGITGRSTITDRVTAATCMCLTCGMMCGLWCGTGLEMESWFDQNVLHIQCNMLHAHPGTR